MTEVMKRQLIEIARLSNINVVGEMFDVTYIMFIIACVLIKREGLIGMRNRNQ